MNSTKVQYLKCSKCNYPNMLLYGRIVKKFISHYCFRCTSIQKCFKISLHEYSKRNCK